MEESINKSAIQNGGNHFPLKKASRVGGPVTCVSFSPFDPLAQTGDRPPSSFFFVAQGPYLIRYSNGVNSSFGDCLDADNRYIKTEQEQQLLVFPEDERRPRGGGTIHGIHFLEQEKEISTSWDAVVFGAKRLTFCNLLGSNIERRNTIRYFQDENEKSTPIAFGKEGNLLSSISSFLELDDWIWNVKTFPKKLCHNHRGDNATGNSTQVKYQTEIMMVIGYARHMIEVWNVKESISGTENVICASRLRRLCLSPPTVVTSMDFIFLYEQHQSLSTSSSKEHCNEIDSLWIAAGTSFHKIWISRIPMRDILRQEAKNEEYQCDEFSRKFGLGTQIQNHHLLKGHLGVVHCVRWFQDGDRISLASTSDDRSVRKWAWDDTREEWIEKWVGWGHSARVWSVATVSSNMSSSSPSQPCLISVAEDGTARVWSSASGEILACIHHSATLWTVDTQNSADGGMFIIGGTDGISAIYNICNYVSGKNMLAINDIAVPDDRPRATTTASGDTIEESLASDVTLTKKKKKKKKKIQSQVIVGVKCWRDGSTRGTPRVIVATRSGSLMSFCIKERKWEISDKWWEPSIQEKFGIQVNEGNCMAVHDGIFAVAIGTSRGDIILTSLHPEKGNNSAIFNARQLRAVQGLSFLDSSCLVSFHVHSVALWKMDFDTFPTSEVVEPSCVLNVETKGIPQSCAYDQVNQRVVVGDSRGNLVYFQTTHFDPSKSGEHNHVVPTCVAHKVHQKQHITSVKWLNQNAILSAGNDGCMHVSYLNGDSLEKGWSYPAPSLTGVTSIISTAEPTIVAGYHGNTYRVLDIDSGYEYIRSDTGGRQRILDCSFNIVKSDREVMPPVYQLVVCKAEKDGSNHLSIQHSKIQSIPMALKERSHITKGVKLHGETIFDSKFFTLSNEDVIFLVTASEDCSSRISSWKDGLIVDSVQLTTQESCCRCLTISQIDDKSVLLVVGGGKLALQFFLIKKRNSNMSSMSTRDLEIRFLGNGLTSKEGATIDHRFNSISAVALLSSEDRSHFVLAGDSEGNSHAFLISEENHQSYRNLSGLLVQTPSVRPILCIETVLVGNRIFIIMGTTGGDIDMFDLPALRLSECWDNFSTIWNPIGSYHGHQMGTNVISAELLSLEMTNGKMHAMVSIVSGGDDQALCTSVVSLEQIDDDDTHLQLEEVPHINIIPEASFSAIKGISCVHFCSQRYLLSVGYSQQLSIWRFLAEDDMQLECISRLPVDLGDVNCLSVYSSADESTYLVAVCGMGVEMFQYEN